MENRTKNILILIILISFLIFIIKIPVTCIFKSVTGISCPACGMTRAFYSILQFNLINAISLNILSIPLFIFLATSIIIMTIEIFHNKFNYIPKIINILGKYWYIIILLVILSFIFNLFN